MLEMLSRRNEAELCVLRFADAFWLLPFPPDERKWFTCKLRGKYCAVLRDAKGSRNAPLGWETCRGVARPSHARHVFNR